MARHDAGPSSRPLSGFTAERYNNTGVGAGVLGLVTTALGNTGVGAGALARVVTSDDNTAVGNDALSMNTADGNTAVGHGAMLSNTVGAEDVATGNFSLFQNTTGSNNTSFGYGALRNNVGGSGHIALGTMAAVNVAGGNSNNIGSHGVSTDRATIRIGATGTQTSFFGVGVRGVNTGLDDAVPVVISSTGQLGTVSSSRRFKEDILDKGDASRDLMRLRPVTFHDQKPFADGSKPVQYMDLLPKKWRKFTPNWSPTRRMGRLRR